MLVDDYLPGIRVPASGEARRPVSFMVNNRQWSVYGAIVIVVGLSRVVWSNMRRAPRVRHVHT